MTPLDKIHTDLSPELDRLHQNMLAALASDYAPMNHITEGYLKTHGKQIRPILVILAARLFGDVTDTVIHAASAIEMLHNASLIHDDVVDESKLRRGVPTLNSVWDNHISVLVGDFFTSCALYQAILTADIRIVRSIAELGRELSLGEINQIFNARDHTLSEDAYMAVISRKTASLFVSCVQMGAYAMAVDDPSIIDPLSRYAELLGRCFQIRDDIFDYFGDAKIGKPTGNDLREGKITLPLLHVLCRPELPGHAEMLALSRKEELSTDDINTLIAYARDNGGIDYAYAVMEQMFSQATEILSARFADRPEAIASFSDIFSYIISRSY